MGMKRRPEALEAAEHDLLIIGGGITGACLAFDAATRGMKVALIERDDFGGATSAASSATGSSEVPALTTATRPSGVWPVPRRITTSRERGW